MKSDYDLIVIGSGSAGSAAAYENAAAGRRVAVIDNLPFGGTCALRGCDPKKILRRTAEVADAASGLSRKGVVPGQLSIDWGAAQRRKRAFTGAMSQRLESALTAAGITPVHGRASFSDANKVEVDGHTLSASHFVIATGAIPRPMDFAGHSHVINSTQFMDLFHLPPRILFIGGGFISFEFAHMVARAGVRATIATHGARSLTAFDPDLVDLLLTRTAAAGVDVLHQTHIRRITRGASGYRVILERQGQMIPIEVDLIVHGAGRVPNLSDLCLEAAGIEFGPGGVTVSKYLQSASNPQVYAAGDAAHTGTMRLTPIAGIDGLTAGRNILVKNKVAPDYTGVPAVVFTIPELVRVGMLEDQARAQGIDVDVRYNDTSDWYSNFRVGETAGATKIIVDRSSDRIIGAHLFGVEYAEIVNTISLAMRLGLTTRELKSAVTSYPSVGNDLKYML